MRLTVLGGCGAWPAAGAACSGYLLEHDGYRVLVDPGYAVLPKLLTRIGATEVDAVVVTHGHPDHCADLNPLLRARTMADDPPPALPVYSPPGAVDRVLALDRPAMTAGAYLPHAFTPGEEFEVGPFAVRTWLLPHFVPNAGLRMAAGGRVVAYTGDTGPAPELVDLARDVDVYLAEATHPEEVPADNAKYLSSAAQAGETAARAGAGQLVLTHLWPGTDPEIARAAAARGYGGAIAVADEGLSLM
jgi:ribonuclease BN (tRNA processing enzyme)